MDLSIGYTSRWGMKPLYRFWPSGPIPTGSASITASALSSKTSPWGWRLGFSRAFPPVRFVFGSSRPRLASSNLPMELWGSTTHLCDPAARFHHHAAGTMIHRTTSPPGAGRPGAQSDRRFRCGRNHRATRATGHVNELRVVVARTQHPEQPNRETASDGDFRQGARLLFLQALIK